MTEGENQPELDFGGELSEKEKKISKILDNLIEHLQDVLDFVNELNAKIDAEIAKQNGESSENRRTDANSRRAMQNIK